MASATNEILARDDLDYDRLTELKSFDGTKAGVSGLIEDGVEKVPRIFIRPIDELAMETSSKSDTHFSIPVIDLSGRHCEIVEGILRASETWGFFQLVNHEIPMIILEEMLQGIRRFNEQPREMRSQFYTRDSTKKFVYNSNFDLYRSVAANWRDTIFCTMAPDSPDPEDLPHTCRDIFLEFSKQITKQAITLFVLISEALGLNPKHLEDMGCAEGLALACHYYPPCPEPELTLGASKHSDTSFLTILLQDQIGGLQVLHQDKWVHVPPMHGALVINIGDLLQLVSNDRLKSSEHRVAANKEGPRMSVACFISTQLSESTKVYGPVKELLSEEKPAQIQGNHGERIQCSF